LDAYRDDQEPRLFVDNNKLLQVKTNDCLPTCNRIDANNVIDTGQPKLNTEILVEVTRGHALITGDGKRSVIGSGFLKSNHVVVLL